MPKKKTEKKNDDKYRCYCPLCKFMEMLEEKRDKEKPEFVKHFFNAHKEVLLGLREMIDWKIEKIEEKAKPKGSKRVKKVEIKK